MKKRIILTILALTMLLCGIRLTKKESVKAIIEDAQKFTIKQANFTYNQLSNNFIEEPKQPITIGELFTTELATGTYNNTEYTIMQIQWYYVSDTNYQEFWCMIFVKDSAENAELYNTDERVVIQNNTLENYNYTTQTNEFLLDIEWTPTYEMQEEIENQNLTNNQLLGTNQWFNFIENSEQLETPIIERVGKNRIQWETIENARLYEIEITNNNIITTETTTENYYEITEQNGTNTIRVRAKQYEYENIQSSEWSNTITITYTRLETPIITINLNTIKWNNITGAEYYEIYKDNEIIGISYSTQWVTIENGYYKVKAIASNNDINNINSNFSNAILQENYNDMIGNGVNWFTFFSAFVDSQIYLIKSITNYTIWDINFFQLFSFIITIILAVIIIKFVKGF